MTTRGVLFSLYLFVLLTGCSQTPATFAATGTWTATTTESNVGATLVGTVQNRLWRVAPSGASLTITPEGGEPFSATCQGNTVIATRNLTENIGITALNDALTSNDTFIGPSVRTGIDGPRVVATLTGTKE